MIRKHINNNWNLCYTLEQQKERFLQNEEEIAENLRLRLQFYKGGSFFATKEGVNYAGILGNDNSYKTISSEIYNVAKKSGGVKSIDRIDIETKDRVLKITIQYTSVNLANNSIEVNN